MNCMYVTFLALTGSLKNPSKLHDNDVACVLLQITVKVQAPEKSHCQGRTSLGRNELSFMLISSPCFRQTLEWHSHTNSAFVSAALTPALILTSWRTLPSLTETRPLLPQLSVDQHNILGIQLPPHLFVWQRNEPRSSQVLFHPGFSPNTHTSATPGFSSEKQFMLWNREPNSTWNSVENNVLISKVASAGGFVLFYFFSFLLLNLELCWFLENCHTLPFCWEYS